MKCLPIQRNDRRKGEGRRKDGSIKGRKKGKMEGRRAGREEITH